MKIKIKKGAVLPNAWKSCGMTKDKWDDLQAGNEIDVESVPELIKANVDVVEETASKPKKTGGK
tara:strand:+ start:721 stop:912 length:192 start_codon:yes stop_codon:yes gene_type:complete